MSRNRMRRLSLAVFAAAATVVAAVGLVSVVNPASAESNGGVRIMPLGDSITEGTQVPGGYRIGLWQRLTGGGYRVDFVGSQFNGPSTLGDHDHEGHPGWRIDQIDANIVGWLNTYQPHDVLLHIGTNDILQNSNVSGAPSRLSTLIDHITATAPGAEVFVAQIIPLANSGQENAVRTFNAAIPGIVQSKANAGKHVHLVDQHSALTAADLTDGIHPTASGYDKMAAVWYNALRAVPGALVPADISPSPTLPSSPSPSSPASGGACRVSAAVSAWNTGLTENLTITNTGSATLNGWNLRFTLPSGQTITSGWNATYAPTSGTVTATNASYNATLAPGASTTIGFQATHTGNTGAPSGVTLNAAACTLS
jgi:lysophospholipase L1-like esterase